MTKKIIVTLQIPPGKLEPGDLIQVKANKTPSPGANFMAQVISVDENEAILHVAGKRIAVDTPAKGKPWTGIIYEQWVGRP